MSSLPALKLEDLRFSAKIDYLSIDGLTRTPLPSLKARCIWPASHAGNRLTIHDPSMPDLRALAELFPQGSLAEMEVAVDIRAPRALDDATYISTLAKVKSDYVAKGLKPRFRNGLNSGFRGAYRRTANGFQLEPFNRRVPGVREQLLYGKRDDGAQVKVYFKGQDQQRSLPIKQHCVRVEVRLGSLGLDAHGITRITDLVGFRFRRELMPYFQHVRGTRRPVKKERAGVAPLREVVTNKLNEIDAGHWRDVGVGAFERGGRRENSGLIFVSDSEVNQRVGQALLRLQRGLHSKNFVCSWRPKNV